MKILVLTDWLAPYRIDLFNAMCRFAEITIIYGETTSPERNPNWQSRLSEDCIYAKRNRKHLPILGSYSNDLLNIIKSKEIYTYDIVYVDGYGSFCQINDLRVLVKYNIQYFLNIDGAIIRQNETFLVKFLKRRILCNNCFYLCGSSVSNKYLMHYGVPKERIFNHNFTSLFSSDILSQIPKKEEKQIIRKKLGIYEPNVILSVGRFSYKNGYGKGYDAILRTASQMSSDYGFYIVGEQPTEEFLKMRQELNATNVHFVGFKQKDELKEYYRAADIFTLMTVYDVWGLVINEAMSNGLPIITTNMCVAGLELIRNRENGYIIKVGDDTALKIHIEKMCEDHTVLREMSKNALQTIRPYTIETVARQHIEVFQSFIDGKFQSSPC